MYTCTECKDTLPGEAKGHSAPNEPLCEDCWDDYVAECAQNDVEPEEQGWEAESDRIAIRQEERDHEASGDHDVLVGQQEEEAAERSAREEDERAESYAGPLDEEGHS